MCGCVDIETVFLLFWPQSERNFHTLFSSNCNCGRRQSTQFITKALKNNETVEKLFSLSRFQSSQSVFCCEFIYRRRKLFKTKLFDILYLFTEGFFFLIFHDCKYFCSLFFGNCCLQPVHADLITKLF